MRHPSAAHAELKRAVPTSARSVTAPACLPIKPPGAIGQQIKFVCLPTFGLSFGASTSKSLMVSMTGATARAVVEGVSAAVGAKPRAAEERASAAIVLNMHEMRSQPRANCSFHHAIYAVASQDPRHVGSLLETTKCTVPTHLILTCTGTVPGW